MASSDIQMRLRVEGAQLLGDLKKVERRTHASLARMRKRSSSTFRRIGASFALIGGGLAVRGSLKPWMDFEAAMSNVAAKTGTLRGELGTLEKEIRRVAKVSRFTAGEVAESGGFLAMAGLDKDAIETAIKPTLDLAAATRTGVEATADLLTNIATPLGLLNKTDFQRTADVLAKVTSDSNVSLTELGESMSYAAVEFDTLNLSLEEGAALMGVLGDSGIKGSRGGVIFRQMSKSLVTALDETGEKLTKQAAVFDKYGISVKNAAGEVDLLHVLEQMDEKMSHLTSDERALAIQNIFGARAATGVKVFLKDMDKVEKKIISAHENADEAATQSKKQMDNLEGDILTLKSIFADVRIAFAKAGIGELARQITQGVTEFLTNNQRAFAVAGHVIKVAIVGIGNVLRALSDIVMGPLFPLFAAGIALAFGRAIWNILVGFRLRMIAAIGPTAVARVGFFRAALLRGRAAMVAFWAIGVLNPIRIAQAFGKGVQAILLAFRLSTLKAVGAGILVKFAAFRRALVVTRTAMWAFAASNPMGLFVIAIIAAVVAVIASWDYLKEKWQGVKDIFAGKPSEDSGYAREQARIKSGGRGPGDMGETTPEATMAADSGPTFFDRIIASMNEAIIKGKELMGGMLGLKDLAYGGGGGDAMGDAMGGDAPGGAAGPALGGGGDRLGGDSHDTPADDSGGVPEGAGLFGRMTSSFAMMTGAAQGAAMSINSSFGDSLNSVVAITGSTAKKAGGLFKGLAQTAMQAGGKAAKFAKKLAIVQAVMMGAQAISRAFADHMFPMSAAVAGIVAAKTLIQIKTIKSQPIASAHSGMSTIPETGSYWLKSGERVMPSQLNADLKGFMKGARDKAVATAKAVTNNIFLEPDGRYSGQSILDAFGTDPGFAVEQSEVR